MDLFEKCREFTGAKEMAAIGLYPYFHELQSTPGPEVTLDNKKDILMLGSNNYMGLAADPRVIKAAADALEHYGSTCSGSRFLNGTLDLHVRLEEKLARFMKKEAALLFTTGFTTNLGIISAIAAKGDYILCDRLNHASIYDGCRLSFAKTLKYEHNDMADLKRLLENLGVETRKLII
ncbi:MAG TPA: aminotransferase class I/II-fold pyridoxal phosphate-dependent enzyme, partial [Bacillota bacterium]|nr:aminotransferase class I/II-fold pyridoxal phosphate-dependent enzyme [Bacillota bacterium]